MNEIPYSASLTNLEEQGCPSVRAKFKEDCSYHLVVADNAPEP